MAQSQTKSRVWTLYITTLLLMALMIEATILGLLTYAYINDKDITVWLGLITTPVLALSRFFPSANLNKEKINQIINNPVVVEEEDSEDDN